LNSKSEEKGSALVGSGMTGRSGGFEVMSENPAERSIRVFLILENRLLRDVLGRLLRKQADFLVVGCDRRAECSPERLLETQCDVVVFDFFDVEWLPSNLRIQNGKFSTLKSLLIGMDGDFETFVVAVCGGVTGYLSLDASLSEIIAGMRAMVKGEAVCPPKLCADLFQYVSVSAKDRPPCSRTARPDLTLRQQQLITLVAKGLTNKQIASQLNLSEFTVKNHVHRIMKRVDAGSRKQAVETILSCGYSIRRMNSATEPSTPD
jgi:DNA-binding NarL/FixJ family response regulator